MVLLLLRFFGVSVAGFSELRLQGVTSVFKVMIRIVSVAGFSELRLQVTNPSTSVRYCAVSVAGFSELRLQVREITLF